MLLSQPSVKLLINGEFRESQATEWVDVTNPVRNLLAILSIVMHFFDHLYDVYGGGTSMKHAQATQEVVSRLPETTPAEFNAAVQAAKDAFPKWRNTSLPTRSRVMFKMQELIRANMVCSLAPTACAF